MHRSVYKSRSARGLQIITCVRSTCVSNRSTCRIIFVKLPVRPVRPVRKTCVPSSTRSKPRRFSAGLVGGKTLALRIDAPEHPSLVEHDEQHGQVGKPRETPNSPKTGTTGERGEETKRAGGAEAEAKEKEFRPTDRPQAESEGRKLEVFRDGGAG